jgi:glycosyltransferase involved in cell wall biosynthesis
VAALCQLAGDPALRERFGAAGAQRAPQFSWPSITEQYVAAYHDAAGMAERPSPLPTLAST